MYLPVGLCGGGVARPLAAVSRRLGQVSGRAERGWSFGLWLVRVGKCVGRGQSPKPSHRGEGSDGMIGVFGFGSLCWTEGGKRSKPKAQSSRDSLQPKHLKFPKFLLYWMILGSSNNSRNTSREQVYNQTAKKYVILYSIVNVS